MTTTEFSIDQPAPPIEITVGAVNRPPVPYSPKRLSWFVPAGLAMFMIAAAGLLMNQPSDTSGVLVGDGEDTISLIDPDTGQTVFSISGALAAPDGSVLYRVAEEGDRSVVQQVDPSDGSVKAEQAVPPRLKVRLVGVDGMAAVLAPSTQGHRGLYSPEPREVTDFTIVWKDGRPPKTFHLEGNFEPETFTLDGSVLYLLEFAPATNPDHYLVRQLNLENGLIGDVYTPEVPLNPEMRGHARAQAIHPDGTFMYTLYTVGSGEPVTDGEGDGRYGFVHVISLERDWSFCIFLPLPIGQKESGMGLAVDPDGQHLYVVDSVAKKLAEIDAIDMVVTRTASIELLGNSAGTTPIAVSRDAGRLFVSDGYNVFAIDTVTLQPALGWRATNQPVAEPAISDIRISADGAELWVSMSDGIKVIAIDQMRAVRTISAPKPGGEIRFLDAPGLGQKFEELQNFFCAC